ncbi:MAG: hypothetical protein ACFFAZ_04915 [Promethearchaeota archaeon]
MNTRKKRLKLIGLILLLVAAMFLFLWGFGIIPLSVGPSMGVTIIMLTIFLPAIVGICLFVAGAAMKSE